MAWEAPAAPEEGPGSLACLRAGEGGATAQGRDQPTNGGNEARPARVRTRGRSAPPPTPTPRSATCRWGPPPPRAHRMVRRVPVSPHSPRAHSPLNQTTGVGEALPGQAVINGFLEVDLQQYIEMFFYMRPIRRLHLEKILPPWLLHSRALSGAEAINALRPFYFAVHPDFFGQHPKEREINENSLKKLSAYLENLQKPGFKSLPPTQLTFYVRETEQTSSDGHESLNALGFRAVTFTLHSRDLLSTVLDILSSCSLSTQHIPSSSTNGASQAPTGAKRTFDRPIKWDKTYYSFTGFKDPEEEAEGVQRMETSLMSWLDSNEKSAIKKLTNSLPLREELDRLKNELSRQLLLSDIRWQRSWGVAHRCSQLHSLGRLAQQNLEALRNIKGCTIVFTDRSGMSALGHVMLGTMDVHHHWTKLFETLPSYFALQRKLVLLQDQISYLLGGIQVVYVEELQPALTIEEYYSLLDSFYTRLLKTRLPLHPRSLRGLQMILDSNRYSPSLHDLGYFSIPSLCDPVSLQWFIFTKAAQARENMRRKDELKLIENELIHASIKKFSLKKLYKEPSVSSAQMIDCCKRLLEQSLPYLQGMHVCISHFYSVLQDGDLCIPWNWKS